MRELLKSVGRRFENAAKLCREVAVDEAGLDDHLVARWASVKTLLAAAQHAERQMRDEVAAYIADAGEGKGATRAVKYSDGVEVKLTLKFNHKIDVAALEAAKADPALAGFPFDTVFVYKPALSVAAWKKLTEPQRLAIRDVVTTTPGAPDVKLLK